MSEDRLIRRGRRNYGLRRGIRRISLHGSDKLGKFQGRRNRKLRQKNKAKKLCRVLLVGSYLEIKGFKTPLSHKRMQERSRKGGEKES